MIIMTHFLLLALQRCPILVLTFHMYLIWNSCHSTDLPILLHVCQPMLAEHSILNVYKH